MNGELSDAFQPKDFSQLNAYPNPFNQRVTLEFALSAAAPVKLTVYDIAGNEVANLVESWQTSGLHNITFNAKDLTSGVYFAQLTSGNSISIKKLILIK